MDNVDIKAAAEEMLKRTKAAGSITVRDALMTEARILEIFVAVNRVEAQQKLAEKVGNLTEVIKAKRFHFK
jgi:hypothetical protein